MNKKWGRGQGFYQKYSLFRGGGAGLSLVQQIFFAYWLSHIYPRMFRECVCWHYLSIWLQGGFNYLWNQKSFLMYILPKFSVFIIYIRHYRQSLKFQINFLQSSNYFRNFSVGLFLELHFYCCFRALVILECSIFHIPYFGGNAP